MRSSCTLHAATESACAQFGVVVTWNLSSGQEAEAVWQLAGKHMSQRLPESDIEVDELEVECGGPTGQTVIKDDCITISKRVFGAGPHCAEGFLECAPCNVVSARAARRLQCALCIACIPCWCCERDKDACWCCERDRDDMIAAVFRCADDVLIRIAVSLALAQSTRISAQETQVMEIVLGTKELPFELVRKGSVTIPHGELAILIGKVFLQKSALNLQVCQQSTG